VAGCTALPKEHVFLLHVIQVFIKEDDVRICPTYLVEERSTIKRVIACTHTHTYHIAFPDIESVM
jgi:hypothetical protein